MQLPLTWAPTWVTRVRLGLGHEVSDLRWCSRSNAVMGCALYCDDTVRLPLGILPLHPVVLLGLTCGLCTSSCIILPARFRLPVVA